MPNEIPKMKSNGRWYLNAPNHQYEKVSREKSIRVKMLMEPFLVEWHSAGYSLEFCHHFSVRPHLKFALLHMQHLNSLS